MKLMLNKTKVSSERYTLIDGKMGCAGEPKNHANHKYAVVNGVDKGNGYQGYHAISYFLTLEYVPQEAKDKVIEICKYENLIYTS